MKNHDELVSVIMPCFNSAKYIEYSINSVIGQTYQNWELIVIDDCSEDNTSKIVDKIKEKAAGRINFIRNESNVGADESRNIGISITKRRFLAFIDADDLCFNDKLIRQLSFMSRAKSCFCFTAFVVDERDSQRVRDDLVS